MITFKTIRWKNLLSTGNLFTEVQFNKTKTTLMLGENGAGKSTLLDALTFVLFNKPYRSINLPQLVNSVNEKDCVAEIEFTKGDSIYKVIRGQSPKVFEIWEDGKLIDQDAKAKDYQKFLEDQILGMNYKSFCQVVILGSANYVPFMKLSAADRRSVVEAILDIGVFSVMNVHLKERFSQNREELNQADSALAVARERVTLLRRMVEDAKKRSEQDSVWEAEQVAQARVRIGEAQEAIRSSEAIVEALTASIIDQESVEGDISRYEVLRGQITKRAAGLRKEIAFYEKNDTCPTCCQQIDGDFKKRASDKAEGKIKEIEEAIEEMAGHIDRNTSRMTEIKKVLSDIRDATTNIHKKRNEIENTEDHIKKILSKKVEEPKDFQNDLTEAMSGENECLENKKELLEEQHYLYLAQTILRDSGIKSRIVKNYIPVINETINRYLTRMNFFVNFHLDEEFNETIKSRHRDVFTYASFSEGEKKRIDLSLLFAWRAIASMKNSIRTNLLILDEVLDGSLDDGSVEAFLDIVSHMGDDTNIVVISHKPKELLQDKFERTIQFVKKGNFSKAT
jgi:DNA repair exonuclease SbcCD ATPase subunit